MKNSIWYITKYFSIDEEATVGSRGRFLIQEFVNQGFKATVITSDSNNLTSMPELFNNVTVKKDNGFNVVWLKTIKYTKAKSLLRIISWLHFEYNLFFLDKKSICKPDVIIVSSLSLFTILNGILLKSRFNCKLIFEVRDIWPLTLVEEGNFKKNNILVKVLSMIEKIGYQKSDSIVGTMPNLKQHVMEVLGYEKPVHCIPMGVNKKLPLSKNTLSHDYLIKYLDQNYFNIVHAGTVGITNALDTFFEAAELLVNNNLIRFVIVGDGALKKYYQEKYGHLENVIFAPKVAPHQVSSVLEQSQLLYFSTFKSKVWDYGQSLNKIIDYMRSGKPILGSYSGYPSMINEAECGFYVPAEDPKALVDKIIQISEMSLDERKSLGLKGRDWLYKNRPYNILASQYLEIMFD